MRAFVAVGLPQPLLRVLAAARDALIDADPRWSGEKWVASENLHLTLRFLGEVPDSESASISAALAEAVAGMAPFGTRLAGVRAVPSRGRARMLWAVFDDTDDRFGPLAAAVSRATLPWAEHEEERKPFRAHATLVRARKPRPVAAEALAIAEAVLASPGDGAGSMSVRHVMLVASTLTPSGPVYEEVATIPLG